MNILEAFGVFGITFTLCFAVLVFIALLHSIKRKPTTQDNQTESEVFWAAFERGRLDVLDGQPSNPYPKGTISWYAWHDGRSHQAKIMQN